MKTTIFFLLISMALKAQTYVTPVPDRGQANAVKISRNTGSALPYVTLSASPSASLINNYFTLADSAKTSAGVYTTGGVLVRTLWSGVTYPSGTHIFKWDGLLDDLTTAPVATYEIKVLSHNVKYEWEGAIGNTSGAATTGSGKHRTLNPTKALCIVGTTMYCGAGYNEGWPATYKVSTSSPQVKTWIGALKQTNIDVSFICSDGTTVYWAGCDPIDTYETFVLGTNVSNDNQVAFSSGVSAQMDWGGLYAKVIGRKYVANSFITGLAVGSSYLFVARSVQNELLVLNKTTGAVVQTLTYTAPTKLAVDGSFLWMVHNGTVEKYTINGDGTLTTTGITITGLQYIVGIGLNTSTSTLVICEGGTSQILRAYNSSGSSVWTFGTSGGYATDPAITNSKFYFKDVNRDYQSSVAFESDGSFWVCDGGNKRIQHYESDRTFIERIMYFPATYRSSVDPNDVTRLFADFIEITIDYTQSIDNCWTPVKNWMYNFNEVNYDGFGMIRDIITFSNGRTYGWARKTANAGIEIVEFPPTGNLRFTGVVKTGLAALIQLQKDDSYIQYYPNGIGSTSSINQYALSSFDGSNNPVWPGSPTTVTTTPALTAYDPYLGEGARGNMVTSNNNLILFDYGPSNATSSKGYHLAAIPNGGSAWEWRTAQTTALTYTGPFPTDGWFDSGNSTNYPGGSVAIGGQNIFWGFHGEFWKGGQTNMWDHYYDNGLYVSQFGEISIDHNGEEAAAGLAGNTLSGHIVVHNSDTSYLYHNDESNQAGIHRWRITGLNTIAVQTATATASPVIPPEGIDLLTGLTRGATLTNGVAGWTRNPTSDTYTGDRFNASMGKKSYDLFKNPDLSIVYAFDNGTAHVSRSLGSNSGLSSWKVWGIMNWDTNSDAPPGGEGGAYMEVLDNAGLVISRFFTQRDATNGTNLRGNGQLIYNSGSADLAYHAIISKNQPIEISYNGSQITFKYANFTPLSTTVKVDASADWDSPTTLRFYFWTNNPADNLERSFDISEMRFVSSVP